MAFCYSVLSWLRQNACSIWGIGCVLWHILKKITNVATVAFLTLFFLLDVKCIFCCPHIMLGLGAQRLSQLRMLHSHLFSGVLPSPGGCHVGKGHGFWFPPKPQHMSFKKDMTSPVCPCCSGAHQHLCSYQVFPNTPPPPFSPENCSGPGGREAPVLLIPVPQAFVYVKIPFIIFWGDRFFSLALSLSPSLPWKRGYRIKGWKNSGQTYWRKNTNYYFKKHPTADAISWGPASAHAILTWGSSCPWRR